VSEEDNTGMRQNENTNELAGIDRNTDIKKTHHTNINTFIS
jgi:hypothetical protein